MGRQNGGEKKSHSYYGTSIEDVTNTDHVVRVYNSGYRDGVTTALVGNKHLTGMAFNFEPGGSKAFVARIYSDTDK